MIDEFKDDRIFSDVDFIVGRDDFLYEPYGVYYYYAFIQKSISLGEKAKGKTYLIYDMGGSTTDVGIVQINRQGKIMTAYPICKSIDCAGAYFDRFILKYLRGDERLQKVSAKWNPEFEKIEQAKILLCTEEVDKVDLNIKGETHTLTREKIAAALQELWNDDNRPLAQGFRGFLDEVHKHAQRNPLFLEFDKIEKAFLAGGSTGLPGLKELILDTLKSSRFDLVTEQTPAEEIFEEPVLASSSSISALGRVAELANIEAPLVLSRAKQLFAKIIDETGKSFVFPRRLLHNVDNLAKENNESFLFSIQELESKLGEGDSWTEFEEGEYQNYNLKSEQTFPKHLEISLRTDISEYPSEPHFSEKMHEGLEEKAAEQDLFWLTTPYQAQYDEDSVRIKPFVLLNYPNVGERMRLYRKQGSQRISLKPGNIDGNVHIGIDLGMNNTSVAICTPGHPLPDDIDDLKILRPERDSDEKEEDAIPEKNGDVSGDGAFTSSNTMTLDPSASANDTPSILVQPRLKLPDEIICNFFLPKLPGSHAVANTMEYVDAISEEKAPRLHNYTRASQILELIGSGLPGQTAV